MGTLVMAIDFGSTTTVAAQYSILSSQHAARVLPGLGCHVNLSYSGCNPGAVSAVWRVRRAEKGRAPTWGGGCCGYDTTSALWCKLDLYEQTCYRFERSLCVIVALRRIRKAKTANLRKAAIYVHLGRIYDEFTVLSDLACPR